MINITEKYGTIKRLKVHNNIHTNNYKVLICFEMKSNSRHKSAIITKKRNNIDTKEIECHACGLKGHKIKECQTKQNIHTVNLKKTLRSKLEIQEEIQQNGNIKSIKVKRDRYGLR